MPAAKKAYPVISALRLLKPNLIGINGVLCLEGPPVFCRFPGDMEVDTSSRRINKGTFEADGKGIFDFLCLYGEITKIIENDRKLSFALARLNMAYSSKWLETRLLDCMIALESLYLPGESEKQFRLCSYMTSTLSSESERSVKETWNYVREAYCYRSQVVHGRGPLKSKVSIGKGKNMTEVSVEDFVDKIEEYTRRSIRKFIEKGKKVEKVQSDIEEEIIRKIGMNLDRAPKSNIKRD